uniref:Ceramide synthase 4 n=1 Tax=Callorhinchus milii TaxID=7868 RepID=A0A4W3JX04_CALMI
MPSLLDEWLWREEHWLPPGVTWEDMKDSDVARYPRPRDLYASIVCGFAFLAVRQLFERLVALPLSKWMGVKERRRKRATPNPALERFYTQHSKRPREKEMYRLSESCGLSPWQVQTWFQRRRNQDRPSVSQRFCDAGWRFTFYTLAFFAGLAVLFDTLNFIIRVLQVLLPSQYWYYMIELGFYWSLLFRISIDVKRKDFKEQVVHHIATIFLMSFSYCANYIRVGTLVLLVHDASDYIMEVAKMFNYAGWRRVCDWLFVIFALVFLISRLFIFPNVVLYTTWCRSMQRFQPFFGYYFFNALLLLLQLLHLFWAYLILRMAFKFVFVGQIEKDERSDDDEESEGTEEGGEAGLVSSKAGRGTGAGRVLNTIRSRMNNRRVNNGLPKAR